MCELKACLCKEPQKKKKKNARREKFDSKSASGWRELWATERSRLKAEFVCRRRSVKGEEPRIQSLFTPSVLKLDGLSMTGHGHGHGQTLSSSESL